VLYFTFSDSLTTKVNTTTNSRSNVIKATTVEVVISGSMTRGRNSMRSAGLGSPFTVTDWNEASRCN
jgi:hypothetical protein